MSANANITQTDIYILHRSAAAAFAAAEEAIAEAHRTPLWIGALLLLRPAAVPLIRARVRVYEHQIEIDAGAIEMRIGQDARTSAARYLAALWHAELLSQDFRERTAAAKRARIDAMSARKKPRRRPRRTTEPSTGQRAPAL